MIEESPGQAQPLAVIELNGVEFTLLGTAHVSRTSAETVASLIATGDYDAVAIELDAGRLAAITDADTWSKTDLMKVLREGKAGMLAVNLALSAFQQRLADQFGVEPGAEMRAAVQGAKERGLPLLLIDRDIGVTLRRVYANVGWWQRMMLVSGMLASTFTNDKIEEEDIERLKQGDILESTFTEFAEHSEKLYTPLIAERDEYMAAKLRQVAARPPASRPRRVLVVIGAGHLKGMSTALTAAGGASATLRGPSPAAASEVATPTSQPVASTAALQATLARLEVTPPAAKWVKAIPWLILVAVLAGFVVGFLRSPEQGLQLLTDWTLITAGLAGVGTLVALAHPVTILATMVAAPFTTLNPVLGAGFVAAGVELWLRKPSVGDFERLRKDVTTWRGWWSNRAARVLLVFVLSTLGASAGTFLAGARIFGRLLG
ncbi:MAG TPA: TraB/GumN family protein [Trueperaceae bacterium]|nr:TraB/GumN family protein [Trueperaceae bacterium]